MQLVLEGQPRSELEEVLRFATEVGLPITLREVGLSELPKEMLQQIAARATAKGETIHNEPFEVRPDMVADAILAAEPWAAPGARQSSAGGDQRRPCERSRASAQVASSGASGGSGSIL